MATPADDIQTVCIHPRTPAERARCARGVRSKKLVRPHRGLYAPTDVWNTFDPLERTRHVARALGDVHPGWVFCLFTVAAAYGLEVGRDRATPIHVCAPRGGNARDTNHLVRHGSFDGDACIVRGICVTPPLTTVIDCLLELDFPRALAVADSALRLLNLKREDLLAALKRRGRHPRRPVAENAIRYADERSENGGESFARAVMIEQGFMVPELQVWIPDPLNPAGDTEPTTAGT